MPSNATGSPCSNTAVPLYKQEQRFSSRSQPHTSFLHFPFLFFKFLRRIRFFPFIVTHSDDSPSRKEPFAIKCFIMNQSLQFSPVLCSYYRLHIYLYHLTKSPGSSIAISATVRVTASVESLKNVNIYFSSMFCNITS